MDRLWLTEQPLGMWGLRKLGGSCEIRTHGGDKPSPVFKTGALNRSAKLPELHILTAPPVDQGHAAFNMPLVSMKSITTCKPLWTFKLVMA
jgi:hypothetical protein